MTRASNVKYVHSKVDAMFHLPLNEDNDVVTAMMINDTTLNTISHRPSLFMIVVGDLQSAVLMDGDQHVIAKDVPVSLIRYFVKYR